MQKLNPSEISDIIKQRIASMDLQTEARNEHDRERFVGVSNSRHGRSPLWGDDRVLRRGRSP